MPRKTDSHLSADFEISRPQEKILGEPISEWAEDWWEWVLQGPADGNPQTDETGNFADVENDGPVFFIAGTFGNPLNDPVERSFEVPDGTPLLIPILNDIYITFNTDEHPRALANESLRDWKRSVEDLFLVIDGVEVKNLDSHFLRTDFFSPGRSEEGNLLWDFLGDLPPKEDLFPSRSAGYWVMVEDLAPGEHTIQFGGTTSTGISANVIDTIFVV
jgi:hypothetical protein